MSAPLPIRRRMIVLAAVAAAGAVLFLPLLSAGSHQPVTAVAGFALVLTVVATLAAWPGLRCADVVGLPMPYLRRLDGVDQAIPPRALMVSAAWGIALGASGAIALRVIHAPAFPGSLLARILSVVCVAGTLEVVLHLGIMSIVTWLARGRRWLGVVAATVVFVLLQSTGGALDHPIAVILISSIANVATGLVVGWLYASYGLEFAAICRALAYLIPVLAL
ncbi:MAG: hypothetical protein ABI969_13130 [bacterium]